MSNLSNHNSQNPAKLSATALEAIAEVFKVLSDPGRLSILQELKEGEKTVSQLVDVLEMGQPSVSKHLKVLAGANLVHRRKHGVKVFYTLKGELITPLCQLVCKKLVKDQDTQAVIDYSI